MIRCRDYVYISTVSNAEKQEAVICEILAFTCKVIQLNCCLLFSL